MGPVKYNNKKLRAILAFVGSFSVVIYGTKVDWHHTLTSPEFYLVVGISFAAALLLLWFVHYITKRLDVNYGWRSKFALRAVLQLLLGVVAPTILDLVLFSIYFGVLGQNVFENGFFYIDLPIVAGMLLVMNLIYCIHYWMLTDDRRARKTAEEIIQNMKSTKEELFDTFEVVSRGQHLFFKCDDILCFFRNNRKVYLIVGEEEYPIKYTINQLADLYCTKGFVRTSRGMLVNLRMIKGYKSGNSKNKLQLVIDDSYTHLIKKLGITNFEVTKEYISEFKNIFAR